VTAAAIVDAETPNITTHPGSATVTVGATHSLSVAANVADSGTLSYQWFSNTTNSNSGGTIISGATNASYSPPTGTEGTIYYYVIVTNTITDNGDGGAKVTTATSNSAGVIVIVLSPLTWTAVSDSTFGSTDVITGIAFGNNTFIAVGAEGKMARSIDNGVTWTAILAGSGIGRSNFNSTNPILDISYSSGIFIAVGGTGGMVRSTDYGLTWTAILSSENRFWHLDITSITFGNGMFITAGNEGRMARSNNGVVWEIIPSSQSTFDNPGAHWISSITYGNGRFVACGLFSGIMAYSDDGMAWARISADASTFGLNGIRCITYGNGRFVAVGNNGRMAFSNIFD
jgi:photosystem II stability/assembly factor-like uncharacterized protein